MITYHYCIIDILYLSFDSPQYTFSETTRVLVCSNNYKYIVYLKKKLILLLFLYFIQGGLSVIQGVYAQFLHQCTLASLIYTYNNRPVLLQTM